MKTRAMETHPDGRQELVVYDWTFSECLVSVGLWRACYLWLRSYTDGVKPAPP